MGKLIRLELFNFKSYKGHHVLLFGDSYFTSIIGPNGSGKSNSMDAISFVLGIKSSHLRSTQLKDLIYRGRVLKTSKIGADGGVTNDSEESADTSSTQPEEELAGSKSKSGGHHEPQSAWIMAVYEDDAGDEQTWKRSITASGASEYRINNRVVSAKQYNDALEAENILIKARNFLVFQGDVEAIANQNPRELTRLIEQISGSGECKADYERLKAEAEHAAEEQAYMLQQRRGINQEIKQYQDQKKEMDAYTAKQGERDNAIVEHIVWKLHTFQKVLDDARPAMQHHRDEIKEHRRQNTILETALDTMRRQQAASGRELAAAERAIKQADRDIHDRESASVPIREKLAISRRNLEKYTVRLEDINREKGGQQSTVSRLQKDSDTVRKAYDLWQRQWASEQLEQGQTLTEEDLREYNDLRKAVGTETALAQAQVDAASREIQFLEEEKTRHSTQLTRLRSQLDKFEGDLGVLNESKESSMKRQSSLQAELESKNQTLRSLDAERIRISRARTELDEKLQDVLRKLTEADSGRREGEREIRLKETVAGLKRIYPGVKGRVTDLCRPKQRRFDNAVATVLGRNLDSIVVDTEKTAKDCISYLREQRSGQATFIPLDTIAVSAGNAAVKGLMDGVRLAIDTIEFDQSVERAMLYVCADSVVCNDLAIARELRFNRKVDVKAVTMDGTVIHRAGLMTGGRTANDHSGRRRWEASEVDTLNKLREKLTSELASLPSRPALSEGDESGMDEEQLKIDVARVGQELEFLRDEIATLERNIASRGREVTNVRGQIQQLTPLASQVEKTVGSKRDRMKKSQQQVISVEDRVFSTFCQQHGFQNIRDYEERQGSSQQRAAEKRLQFTTQLSRLENQLAFERSRLTSLEDRLARLEAQKQTDAEVVSRAERELSQAEAEVAALVSERDDGLTEALEDARRAHEKRTHSVARARADLSDAGSAIDETIKQLENVEAEARRMAAARYGLLRKCKIDEILIPVTRHSKPLASLPLDVIPDEESQEVNRDDGDEDGMDVDEDDDKDPLSGYGIDVDFSGLEEDLLEDSSPAVESRLLERISSISSELERMAPNMRATNRLDEVEARLSKTERDFESARRTARTARDGFEIVKAKRLQLFNRAFTHISEQIGPVYKDLTRSDAFPLGGQAYLDSEDSEEPYLSGLKYHAMPPLKRFRDMEHLSGGEKTMAALALLFSIHSFQPSPFFVLDEVDAALDNANVGKIARYIAEHAGPGMQFIVISLKLGLFCQSETLVGIMRDQAKNSSMALTLDLRKYAEEGGRREVPGVVTGFSGL